MLRRMMTMWYTHLSQDLSTDEVENPHVPDISTVPGLMVLMAVGNVLECSQILDRRSYSDSGVHWSEHGEMAEARRLYRNIQLLFGQRYVVHVGNNAVSPYLVFKRLLVEFAAAVVVYKKQRVKQADKVPGCTLANLRKKCEAVFSSNHPDLVPCLNKLVEDQVKYFYWTGPHISITRRTAEHNELVEDKDFHDQPIFLECDQVVQDDPPADVEMAAPDHDGTGASAGNLLRRPSGELESIFFKVDLFDLLFF
jgi:hypothetical protein